MSRLKGKINKWLGVTTGDRKQEAIGTVQQQEGRNPSEREVDKAVKEVKEEHHDYGERVPPQEVPHTDR